ncbi:MAG: hypothetical protein JXA49_09895, partial [Actinobacteria bacterium]|nr:hypothetical protein [Actinomycetota bacterium]
MKRRRLLRRFIYTALPSYLFLKVVQGITEANEALDDKTGKPDKSMGEGFVGYSKEKHRVKVRDGTSITSTVFTPEGEGPFPLILMVHSWG